MAVFFSRTIYYLAVRSFDLHFVKFKKKPNTIVIQIITKIQLERIKKKKYVYKTTHLATVSNIYYGC